MSDKDAVVQVFVFSAVAGLLLGFFAAYLSASNNPGNDCPCPKAIVIPD